MLICFIGSPCSGKTTAAAALFSELKNTGHAVEFIPEFAREYIMMNRSQGKKELTKKDQGFIYTNQKLKEDFYKKNSPNSIIISDGSTINSYFYGLDDKLDLREELRRYDMVFFCSNITGKFELDDNRIHDKDFSKSMEIKMESSLEQAEGDMESVGFEVFKLTGSRKARLDTMIAFFQEKYEANKTNS